MSNPFADTLHMRVGASVIQRTLSIVVHAVAAMVVVALTIHRPFLVVLLVAVAISAWRADRRARGQTGDSIQRLRYGKDQRWWWQTRDGRVERGDLLRAYVFADVLVVLKLRAENAWLRRSVCVLFNDALDADVHRRLRARLNIAPRRGPADRFV